jgi:hypothetical protein
MSVRMLIACVQDDVLIKVGDFGFADRIRSPTLLTLAVSVHAPTHVFIRAQAMCSLAHTRTQVFTSPRATHTVRDTRIRSTGNPPGSILRHSCRYVVRMLAAICGIPSCWQQVYGCDHV